MLHSALLCFIHLHLVVFVWMPFFLIDFSGSEKNERDGLCSFISSRTFLMATHEFFTFSKFPCAVLLELLCSKTKFTKCIDYCVCEMLARHVDF